MAINHNPPKLNIIPREEWGALPPEVEFEGLRKPCTTFRLWLYSDTAACHTKEECVKTVQQIQQRNIKQGLEDIRFNFLIGDDGNVYEGRGFDKMPPKDPIVSEIWGRYLEIGFIGNHRGTQRVNKIYEIAYLVAKEAMNNGTLQYDTVLMVEN